MTLFDLIVGVILIVSALVGYTRGAVRELVTVLAFSLAALAAVFLLPFSGPIARQSIQPPWAGNTVAIVVVFIAAYIGFRMLGGWASQRLHQRADLGTLDRSVGLAFGVLRALIFVGVFYLVFNAATPPEQIPSWIADGKTYPLARASGQTLEKFAPKGMQATGRISSTLGERVRDSSSEVDEEPPPPRKAAAKPAPKPAPKGPAYNEAARDNLDSVIERAR